MNKRKNGQNHDNGPVAARGAGWGGMEAFTLLMTNVTLRYAMFLFHVGRYVTLRQVAFVSALQHIRHTMLQYVCLSLQPL